jgi:arsenite methyltransferase
MARHSPRQRRLANASIQCEPRPARNRLLSQSFAGALEEDSYRGKLARAGFVAVDVEPTRIYQVADAKQFLAEAGIEDEKVLAQIDGRFMSAFIRGRKPAAMDTAKTCCAPTCCA